VTLKARALWITLLCPLYGPSPQILKQFKILARYKVSRKLK
jgi:hypothetical protein